jgi:hypothetical protein
MAEFRYWYYIHPLLANLSEVPINSKKLRANLLFVPYKRRFYCSFNYFISANNSFSKSTY